MLVALGLPGGSVVLGSGELAWTMFAKSETYRLALLGIARDGRETRIDPRSLSPLVGASVRYFLPAPDAWRHEPMAVTFRTGLPYFAALACRLGSFERVEALLEERSDLDAAPLLTRAGVRCRR